MKRQIYSLLHRWKNSEERKPFILRGARQVGKTHLLKSFGSKEYTDVDAGLILLCFSASTVKLPLAAYKDPSKFKVYLFDTGLLGAKLDISMKSIVNRDELFSQFSGVSAENYVAQQLTSRGHSDLFYWALPQKAEIDFIYENEGQAFPLKVKSGWVGNRGDTNWYREKFNPEFICITSSRNFSAGGGFCNFPLYAIPSFPELCVICEPPLVGFSK